MVGSYFVAIVDVDPLTSGATGGLVILIGLVFGQVLLHTGHAVVSRSGVGWRHIKTWSVTALEIVIVEADCSAPFPPAILTDIQLGL